MKSDQGTIRLNKFLANAGFEARRKIEDFLKENKVEVNGVRVFESGVRINPVKDQVRLNGRLVEPKHSYLYIMLNKPKGVISTTSDEQGRKSVLSLVSHQDRIYPVGRLDQNTTGLILLTNDGELANKLTHPSFEVSKTYQALVSSKPSLVQLKKLRNGVYLKEGKTAPAQVEIIKDMGNRALLELTLREGKNHEVRRMCSKVGLEVIELKRVSQGPLELGNLPLGKFRDLTSEEIQKLKAI